MRVSGFSSWFVSFFIILLACANEEKFPDIATNLSGPVDVAVSSDGNHFYVLNSDYEWNYNVGSILILDENGNKIRSVETPRLGRSMELAGNRMIIVYDRSEQEGVGLVEYYDLSNPQLPNLISSWPIDCAPIASTLTSSYDYFFVSCIGGDIYIGSFVDSGLFKRVRRYGRTRKALYLDESRQLLLGFVTDTGPQTSTDFKENDLLTFSSAGQESAGANEVPDSFESTKRARRQIANRYLYQYIVYDISAEAAQGFPYRVINDAQDGIPNLESRWLYFSLSNADGSPDNVDDIRSTDSKYYRTNFSKAMPDPNDKNAFYLSHRGRSAGANNVVRVSIIGELGYKPLGANGGCESGYRKDEEYCIPLTSSVLEFERVYGFNGEVDDLDYPGDFEVETINGQQMLVVNHFRDLVYWPPDQRRFSIVSKVLNDDLSTARLPSTDFNESFYAIAVNSRGKGLSCSFYGRRILFLNITPGSAPALVKSIN